MIEPFTIGYFHIESKINCSNRDSRIRSDIISHVLIPVQSCIIFYLHFVVFINRNSSKVHNARCGLKLKIVNSRTNIEGESTESDRVPEIHNILYSFECNTKNVSIILFPSHQIE